MANQIIVQIIGDPENLKKVLSGLEGESKITGQKIGDLLQTGTNQGFQKMAIDAIKAYGGFALIAGAAFYEVGKIISDVFEGENLKAINEQFNLLAQNAGIAGDALKESLEKSSGGLVKESELLQAANRSMVQFSGSTKQLPELLELARKTSLVFGGTVVDNFERINAAIASGNARALRHVGIIIDQQKALRDFAREQGVSVDALSRAGREQAILNATLENGKTAFNGINTNLRENNNNWAAMKVAISDAADVLTKKNETVFGPVLASITGYLKDAALGFKELVSGHFGSDAEKAKFHLSNLRQEVRGLEQALYRVNTTAIIGDRAAISDRLNKQIAEKTELIKKLQLETDNLNKSEAEAAAKKAKDANYLSPEKVAEDKAKVKELYDKSNNDLVEAQLKRAEIENNYDEIERLRNAQIAQVEEEFLAKDDKIKREYLKKGLINEEQYAELNASLQSQKFAKERSMLLAANTVLLSVRKSVQDALVNTIVTGIKTIVTNLAHGESAFKDFGKVMLGLLGGLAIQIGTMVLAAGVAKLELITDKFGPTTIAAGAALIAVGSALEAFAGSSGSTDTGSVGSSFSGAGASTVDNLIGTNTPTQNQSPGTQVEVHIHGNVFDNRETGLAIAQAINDSFGSNGVVLARQA